MYWVIKFRDTEYYNTDTYISAEHLCEADTFDSLEMARKDLKTLREPRSQEALDLILDNGEPYIVKVTPKKKIIHKWHVVFDDKLEVTVNGPTLMEAVRDEIDSDYFKEIISVTKVS
jgi:hypothetical protein